MKKTVWYPCFEKAPALPTKLAHATAPARFKSISNGVHHSSFIHGRMLFSHDRQKDHTPCQTNSLENSCYREAHALYQKLWRKRKPSRKEKEQIEHARQLFLSECSLDPENRWFEESCYGLFYIRAPQQYPKDELKKIFGFHLIAYDHLNIDGPGHGFRYALRSSINQKCYLWEPGGFSGIDCKDADPFKT